MKKNFFLLKAAKRYKGHPALVTPDFELTYGDYYQHVLRAVDRLRDFGINPGDRVGIVSPVCPEYIIILMALWAMGAVSVPVSTRWPGVTVENSLGKIGCRHLVFSSLLSSPPAFRRHEVICLEDIVRNPLPSGVYDLSLPQTGLEQDATIVFTSGSSGRPKPVLHTLGNHYYSALGSNGNISFGPGRRWLLSLPLYHVGGIAILFRAALGGGTVAVPDKNRDLRDNIRELGTTHISLVETQLYRLIEEGHDTEALQGLKAILLGGGPVRPDLVEKAAEMNLPLFTSYGSTEMASQVTATRPKDDLDRLLTSGRVLPYRQIRIAPGGDILVKGATLFKGYLKGNLLVTGRDKGGWFRSGDLGYLDEQGYLTVTGRRDNMFISGGENIQPEAIEHAMNRLDGIADVIVVPVRNKEFGQRPVAFVRMKTESEFNREGLKQELKNSLPHFMVPDHFFPWPEDVVQEGIKINREYFKKIAEKNINIFSRWD